MHKPNHSLKNILIIFPSVLLFEDTFEILKSTRPIKNPILRGEMRDWNKAVVVGFKNNYQIKKKFKTIIWMVRGLSKFSRLKRQLKTLQLGLSAWKE